MNENILLFKVTYSYVEGYELYLNTTNYPIFNMPDFRNGLCSWLFWSGCIPGFYWMRIHVVNVQELWQHTRISKI